MPDLLIDAFLCIITFVTSALSGVTGMGGGVLFLSILTFFFPLSTVIPLHGIVQLFSNSSRIYFLRGYVKQDMFIPFVWGLVPGLMLSLYLVGEIQNSKIAFLLISLLIFYSVFKPKRLPSFKIPSKMFAVVGFIAGVLALVIGAVGPFLANFFLRSDIKKEEIVATKSAMQICVHFAKIPAFLFLGFPYLDFLPIMIVFLFMTFLGTRFGVGILNVIDESIFRIVFKSALGIAGLRLLYKAFY